MLKFALKNMKVKRVQIILVLLSVVISAAVGVLAYNISEQVSDGISGTAGYYSAIIGPSGSKTQLAMNTMYFTDEPLGTIPYAVAENLKQDMRVTSVIPFAIADNYNGYSVVGSTSEYLRAKEVAEGELFDDTKTFEVVVGSTVAKTNQLSVGDKIYTSHAVGDQHTQPFTVVGILEETYTVYDRVVFTQISSIWKVHDHGHEEHEEGEEHNHAEGYTVCAILVKTKNPAYAMTLVNEYDGKIFTMPDGDSFTLQAIEPMDTVRSVLEDTNTTKYIVYILCAIILAMNIMIVSIITLLNMYHSAKEISLMRLIGISMKKINLLYVIQNGLVGLLSVLLAFGVSRLCLVLIQDFVANMGVVLNFTKVYPLEIVILLGIFIISVLPTVICTFAMSKKDSLSE